MRLGDHSLRLDHGRLRRQRLNLRRLLCLLSAGIPLLSDRFVIGQPAFRHRLDHGDFRHSHIEVEAVEGCRILSGVDDRQYGLERTLQAGHILGALGASQGAGIDDIIGPMPFHDIGRRREFAHGHQQIQLAMDQGAKVFGLLPAYGRGDQNPLLICALDDFGRRHGRRLGEDLEQGYEEGVVD